jgi:hypothetical protein
MPSYVETESGYQYLATPVIPPGPIIAAGLVAGNTSLDGGGDGMHLLLHGTLGAGDAYIDCQNDASTSKFKVAHDGKVHTTDVELPLFTLSSKIDLMVHDTNQLNNYITTLVPTQQTHTTEIADIETILNAATPASTQDTLVKRAVDGSQTHFKKAQVEQLRLVSALPNVSLYGQGAFQFIPLDTNGDPQNTATENA